VTIRKGKIAKPNEFGTLVTIQEAEHQIVTAYEIHAARPADVTLWTPALDRHQAIFGRAPDLAAAAGGSARRATNRRRSTALIACSRTGMVTPQFNAPSRKH